MRWIITFLAVISLVACGVGHDSTEIGGPVPHLSGDVTTGLAAPWGLAFLPDGSALVSLRDTGEVDRIDTAGKRSPVGTVPGVVHVEEGGLLGIAVPPDFATDQQVYVFLTTATDNRVVRMTYRPDGLGTPQVVLAGITKGTFHDGGRIAFGPDGLLYIGTGDAKNDASAQDRASLNGKILRIRPDGTVPADNPTPGSLVWTWGHRNVEGLAWDDRGRLWASEFGKDAFDELNLISPGNNYGWPAVEGFGGKERGFTDPQRAWPVAQASPSGIAFAGGSIWMAALRGSRLWQIPIPVDAKDATRTPKAWFVGQLGRLRSVTTAPDGSLWLITNNTDGRGTPKPGDDRIVRITLS